MKNGNNEPYSLARAREFLGNAKKHAPNFGQSLIKSLYEISHIIEMLPLPQMDFDTYFKLNLDVTRLGKDLSVQGLEKEAFLAERISKDFTHRYTTSHPL